MDCEYSGFGLGDYIKQLKAASFRQGLPFKGIFELTPRCNFNCKMCYVHLQPEEIPENGTELSLDDWLKIAESAKQSGMLELTLTGGEPFVRKDFKKLYERLSEMGFLIQIFTNGYLIDEKTVDWLKQRPPYAVRITLYGVSDDTYRRLCGIENGFTRVKNAVELLIKENISLYLVSTVTNENAADLKGIYDFAGFYGLPVTHTMNLVPPVRGAKADIKSLTADIPLPPPEAIKEIRKNGNGRYPKKPLKNILDACGNYRNGFLITWSGQMQLCAFLTVPQTDVMTFGFHESWKMLLEALEKIKQPRQCAGCKYEQYCDRCPGLMFSEISGGKINSGFCQKAERNYEIFGKPLT